MQCDAAARRKAERSAPLLAGHLRSRCPRGETSAALPAQSPSRAAVSKQKKPSLWFALRPLTLTVLLKTCSSPSGALRALEVLQGGTAGRRLAGTSRPG